MDSFGDYAILADLLHNLGDEATDFGVGGGDGGDLSDLVLACDGDGESLELFHGGAGGGFHATFNGHRVGAGGHVLHAIVNHGLGKNGSGGGAVTSDIVSLCGDFLDELCAHILERVLDLDFLGDSHTIIGDSGRAKFLVEDNVAALGAEGDLNRVSEGIDSLAKGSPSVFGVFQLFCWHLYSFLKPFPIQR